jgi:hypothetical protein
MLRSAAQALLLAAALSAAAVDGAQAAQVGSAATGPSATVPTSAIDSPAGVQEQDGAGARYSVPAAGILTSWTAVMRTPPDSPSPGVYTLKVFRPQAGGSFLTIASEARPVSAPLDPPAGQAKTFSTHIPVTAGDRLGYATASGAVPLFAQQIGAIVGYTPHANPGPVTPFAPSDTLANTRVLLAATVEADADRDGFADVSEDACPGTPQRHTAPCVDPDLSVSLSAAPHRVRHGRSVTLKASVRERAGGSADSPLLAIAVPEGFKVLSIRPQRGSCHGRALRVCRPGPIGAHASVTVSLKLKASTAGHHRAEAEVAQAGDRNTKNDRASAVIAVTRGPQRR